MKACTKCGEVKPLCDFYERRQSRDGRRHDCKACISTHKKMRRADPEVKAKTAARDAAYRSRPDVKERMREVQAKRYAEKAEQVRARVAEYRAKNKEAILARRVGNREYTRARDAQFRANNPHKSWEDGYRRRAMKYGFTPLVVSFTLEDLIERYGDSCVDCGGEWTQVDHVTPVRLGGEHSLSNCQPVCGPCNLTRWNRLAQEAYDIIANIYSGETA